MKKILKLLLLTILFIPYLVKADMGAPMIKPYDMVVTNQNGIDYYTYNNGNLVKEGHLNKDDTFTVYYEYNNYDIKIKNDETTYTIKSLDGAILLQDEVDPRIETNGVYSKSTNNEALVYASEGVDVRKGPSSIYPKVGHFDKDTKLKYTYYYSDGSGIINIYVEQDGIKGWIEILETKVLLENSEQYIAKIDYNMGCATIAKNTIITPKYTSDAWSRKVLIEYNGCTKLYEKLNDNSLIGLANNEGTANADIDVYEYYKNGGNKLTTIPKDAKFDVFGIDDTRGEENGDLYVAYGTTSGWIHTEYKNYSIKYNDEPTTLPIPTTTTASSIEPEPTTKTPTSYITKYIIICSVIVLTALVVITLINQKKGKTNIYNEK